MKKVTVLVYTAFVAVLLVGTGGVLANTYCPASLAPFLAVMAGNF